MRKIDHMSCCEAIQQRLVRVCYEATLKECEEFWRWRCLKQSQNKSNWDVGYIGMTDKELLSWVQRYSHTLNLKRLGT